MLYKFLYNKKGYWKMKNTGEGVFMTRKGFLGIIAVTVIMSFAFIGCSGKGGLSGTWESDDYYVPLTWTFAGNKLTQEAMGETVTIPFRIKRNTIAMVYEGEEVEFDYQIDGDTLTVDMMGMSVEFKRVKDENTEDAVTAAIQDEDEIPPDNGANFGAYPADYGIAYFSMLGFSPAPTVRGLFGPNAKFITSLRGTPAAVTLENATGTAGEFTGQLLLTLKDPEAGGVKAMRLLVTFESDNTAEMSYCRYIKLVSLVNGSITERRSDGSQDSDANILGILAGVMEAFWDT
jgi:hypothetical protein